jgi:hypothetical protein
MEEDASTTAPCINVRYPPVDLPESGQSWNEASEKTTIGNCAMLLFPVIERCQYSGAFSMSA